MCVCVCVCVCVGGVGGLERMCEEKKLKNARGKYLSASLAFVHE